MRADLNVQGPADARVNAELARARAEVASALAQAQAKGSIVNAGDGTRIVTSADGRTTTITEPGGKETVISTGADGQVTITTNDHTVTLPSGMPWTTAIQQLMARQQTIATVPAPMPPMPREQIPDGIVPLIGIIFGMIAATIIGLPIARAFARRVDKRSATIAPSAPPELSMRLDRIEQAIESMAVEVERVSEAQRYSARLLTERLPEVPARAIAAEHAR